MEDDAVFSSDSRVGSGDQSNEHLSSVGLDIRLHRSAFVGVEFSRLPEAAESRDLSDREAWRNNSTFSIGCLNMKYGKLLTPM